MDSTSNHPFEESPKFLKFSTHGIVPNDRVQMWEGHNARALLPLDIRTIDGKPLHATESNLHLPSVRMASVFGTSQFVERSEKFIADNPTGVVAVFFATEGDAVFFHTRGHVSLRPGQAIVYDADVPFLRGFNNRFQELVLTIPKPIYEEIVGPKGPQLPAIFEFGARGTANEQALARLINESLKHIEHGSLRHIDNQGIGGDARLPGTALEEQAVALVRNVLGETASSEKGLLSAAKSYIDLNIASSSLSTGRVAAAVNISERQLSRLFAEAGTTVSRYVLHTRLDFAKQALSSPEYGAHQVGDIGKRFGFSSPSHFSRTFRERFDMTPLQWRKESERRQLFN
ncbi:helix-turn-helix domain-containing protein [Corynebacterium pilosum]|uniref:AraC-type DNA-binding domain-containing protein n=1 Tax=Corynebacterium pilosum TaxID=35756 RepID=A0A376CMM1_9CORY|nr:AraC-type DNA-binding domain-containing protein [Corynebacterium pilosum]